MGAVRRHTAGPERGERGAPRRGAQKMYADTDGEGARGGLSNGWQWVVVDPARERGAVDAGSPGGMGVRKRQGKFRVRRFVWLTWGAVAAAARGRVGV